MKKWVLLSSVLFLFALSHASIAEDRGRESYWLPIVKEIETILKKVPTAYDAGEVRKAKSHITGAYFGVFEEKRMEQAIRINISAKRAFKLESLFGDMRKGINKKVSVSKVESILQELVDGLTNDAKELDSMGVKGM